MTATVTPFRRDLKKELQALITFDGQTTVEELHHRHERIRLLRQEGYAQQQAGLIKHEDIWPITDVMHDLHLIALRAGISRDIVDEFNQDRWDWKQSRAFCEQNARERVARAKAQDNRR